METFELSLESLQDYVADNHVMAYEKLIFDEIAKVIESGDSEKLNWFAGFGDSFRQIAMNINEHRHALEFGFTEIALNKYGWF